MLQKLLEMHSVENNLDTSSLHVPHDFIAFFDVSVFLEAVWPPTT